MRTTRRFPSSAPPWIAGSAPGDDRRKLVMAGLDPAIHRAASEALDDGPP
jgi:hypothetical protein